MLRGDRINAEDRAILVGFALGRQAPAVGEDRLRREAFDCLMLALEHATYWQAIASGPQFGHAVANEIYRTMYAAAMGMHDDRVLELTGYTPDTPLPDIFDIARPDPALQPGISSPGQAGRPIDGHFVWQRVPDGDCPGNDIDSTAGFAPVQALAGKALTAVCWDGSYYRNQGQPSAAFCTYKSIDAEACVGGSNTGAMFRAVRVR
jgi:hypothetical protein